MSWWNRFWPGQVDYEQSYAGTDTYFIESDNPYQKTRTNLRFAYDHPILTPGLLFVSNLFAQAKFEVYNKATGQPIEDNKFIKLLSNPNFFQTQIDFLESFQFLKIAQGRVIVYLKSPVGFDTEPEEMFLLRDDLISWPDNFSTDFSFRTDLEKFKDIKIVYDVNGINEVIKIKDLMFFYDLPNTGFSNAYGNGFGNGGGNNLLAASSRLDGLHQTLINTDDSLIAKNTILKSNGKEMLTRTGGGEVAFTPDQQKKAKKMFNTAYGPGRGRSRAFISSASLTWQSLHVALRDLGLDESVKTDGNIIYTALHIPKDILSLEAKKTTYNNFKESMTSYIQNDIQAMANDLAAGFWQKIGDDSIEIKGTYKHLPVMQFALLQGYQAASEQAIALKNLRSAGIPDEYALERVGLPKDMVLTMPPPSEVTPGTESTEETQNGENDGENED